MLLERGPVGFVTDLLDRLKLRGAAEGSGVAASDRMEERVSLRTMYIHGHLETEHHHALGVNCQHMLYRKAPVAEWKGGVQELLICSF